LFDGTRSRVIRHRGGPIGRIKLGTEASGGFRNIAISNCVFDFCRGLALEQVDGAELVDVVVSNLTMREVMNSPIFIRLGGRLRTPAADAVSRVQRIAISNVVAYDVAAEHGIFIAGIPGQPVTDVRLDGIQLYSRGGRTRDDGRQAVPEMIRDYPEPMLFGPLPAWGIYIRHASRIRLRDVTLRLLNPDARPAVILDDVTDLLVRECDGLKNT
jgi:hypothetical protein